MCIHFCKRWLHYSSICRDWLNSLFQIIPAKCRDALQFLCLQLGNILLCDKIPFPRECQSFLVLQSDHTDIGIVIKMPFVLIHNLNPMFKHKFIISMMLNYTYLCDNYLPTKHDVKDIIKTFEDYLQVLQTKTSRHQNVNDLEIIYYLRFA